MEALRSWALTVCGAAVLCTLLQRLFPDTAIGRQGRLLLPCLFLCALLTPLRGLGGAVQVPTFTVEEADSAALETRLRQQTVAQVNTTLLAMANQALSTYGYQAKKVVTDMDISEEGRISMGQITLYVDEDTLQHGAQIRQIVEKRLGTAIVLARWEETP